MANRTSMLVFGALVLGACNATPRAGAEGADALEGATPVPVPSYLPNVEAHPAAEEERDAPRAGRRLPSAEEAFGTGQPSAAPPEPQAPPAPEQRAPERPRRDQPFGTASSDAANNAATPPPSVSNDTGAPASTPPAPQTSLHAPTTAPAPRTSGSTGANGVNTDPNGRAPRTSGSSGAR